MYRKYRVGELPDTQIKYSEIIRPFQALAQVINMLMRMNIRREIVHFFLTLLARQQSGEDVVFLSLPLTVCYGGQRAD